MNVEPIGLPAAMRAWREREEDPVLRMYCSAEPDCGAEVGAVYRTSQGVVVETRISVPQEETQKPPAALDLSGIPGTDFSDILGEFQTSGAVGEWVETTVRAQIDLLNSELYWQDPVPICPRHGELRLHQGELAKAVRNAQPTYEAMPR